MDPEKKKFIQSLFFPTILIIILWAIKIFEIGFDLNFVKLGIYPLKLKGLIGIITAPLIHGDFNHLIDNSIPLFLLSLGIFYFYDNLAYRIFFLIYILTGLWVWFGARESYHIGASGLVYGFASFLFFSGLIRKFINLMAISLTVVFLYGSMVWGIFPIKTEISWESHLMGSIAGLVMAIYYRKRGPQRKKYDWEDEDDDDDDHKNDKGEEININYIYKDNL